MRNRRLSLDPKKSEGNEKNHEDPSPFAGKESQITKQVQITRFSHWYSDILKKEPKPRKEHPISYIIDHHSKVFKYFVVFIKPRTNYTDFAKDENKTICFWQNGDIFEKNQVEELNLLIKNQFSSLVSSTYVTPMINIQLDAVNKQVLQVKLRKFDQRIFFHYIAHQVDYVKDGLSFPSGYIMPLQNLLEASGNLPRCFIFDRDYSGSLLPTFYEYISKNFINNVNPNPVSNSIINNKKKNNNNNSSNTVCDPDIVAFFSCGPNEKLPRSSDYPIDLFTSCLTSPARIALVWHSRHYFCFQSGSLKPISLFFLEELDSSSTDENRLAAEKQRVKQLLDELTSALRSTVEAMALRSMDPDVFVKLFRADSVLSDLTVNFILARRILNFFNTNPVSYPDIPEVNNSDEWHTFDLRLDATLYLLEHGNEPSSQLLSYHHFLSQALCTFQNRLISEVDSENPQNSPFELSFLPSIISDPDLSQSACEALAKYLDSSVSSVDNVLFYQIPRSLFGLLIKKNDTANNYTKYLLFCLVKILAYHYEARYSLFEINQNLIEKVLLVMLKDENQKSFSHLTLILTSLLMKDSVPVFRQLVTDPSVFTKLSVDKFEGDSRIWAISIVASAIPSIKDYSLVDRLLNPICQFSKSAPPELHAIVVRSLSVFTERLIPTGSKDSLKKKKKIELKVAEAEMEFAKSTSSEVRYELLLFAKKFVETNPSYFSINNNDNNNSNNNSNDTNIVDDDDSDINFECGNLKGFLQQANKTKNPKTKVKKEIKPLYQNILNFIKQCESDPSEDIRNAHNSVIGDLYINALLQPIGRLLDGNYSFEEIFNSKLNNENEKVGKPKKQKISYRTKESRIERTKLKLSSSYRHRSAITSNMIFVPENRIAFGDENGSINVKSWEDSMNLISSYHFSSSSIVSIDYIPNGGDSLLFAADSDRCCHILKVESTLTSTPNSASNLTSNESNKEYFSFHRSESFPLYDGDDRVLLDSRQNHHLISYAFNAGTEFHIRDLQSDRFLYPIIPKYGPTKDIKVVSYFDDVVGLIGSGFECFDLRASRTEPFLCICADELESPAVFLEIIDEKIPIFSYALQCHSVCRIDLRQPTGNKTAKVFCNCEPNDQKTFGFTLQRKALTAAISTEDGVFCANVEDHNRSFEEVDPNLRRELKIERASALLFRQDVFQLSIVNNSEYIMTAT